MSSVSLSLHLVHLLLPFLFLSQLPLSGNKAAFSSQSCPSIVGSGVRIQWSCRCPSLHQYFLLRLSLSFLPPSLLQGSRLLCARLGFLQSSVLFAFLSAQSSVSSFVMMRSLVGPVVPPFPFFFLFSVSSLRLQEHVTMSFVDEEKVDEGDDWTRPVHSPASPPPSQRPQECRARRIEGLSTCLPSTSSEFNLCTTTRLQIVVHPVQ